MSRLLLVSLLVLLACLSPSATVARLRALDSALLSTLSRLIQPLATADECDGDDFGVAGQFDLYVLAQSWSAEFCYASAHRSYPGCESPTDWQRVNLTLHGLWPQYTNETGGHAWPQCCNSTHGSELNATLVSDELTQLQLYWPNEEAPSGKPLASSLWAHEWAKHGTCTGLSQLDFLQAAIALMQQLPTPALISSNVGSQVDRVSLEKAYNNGTACGDDGCLVQLQCDGAYLTEVHTCWDRALQQVACPKLVMSDKGQCDGKQVKLSKFA